MTTTVTTNDWSSGEVILAIIGFMCFLVCVSGAIIFLLGLTIGIAIKLRWNSTAIVVAKEPTVLGTDVSMAKLHPIVDPNYNPWLKDESVDQHY